MRQYKFHAWHPENKIMIYDLNSLKLFHVALIPDDYILMQFTGLPDKNEKPIFENDIVKHNFGYTDKRDVICIVKFGEYEDDEGYSTYSHLGWYVDEIKHDSQHSLIDWHKKLEIIGNVFENPNLAEAK